MRRWDLMDVVAVLLGIGYAAMIMIGIAIQIAMNH